MAQPRKIGCRRIPLGTRPSTPTDNANHLTQMGVGASDSPSLVGKEPPLLIHVGASGNFREGLSRFPGHGRSSHAWPPTCTLQSAS